MKHTYSVICVKLLFMTYYFDDHKYDGVAEYVISDTSSLYFDFSIVGIVNLHEQDVQNAEYSLLRFLSDEATNVLTVL